MSETTSRRDFVKAGAAATAGFMVVKSGVLGQAGSNSKLNVAIIGCGGRGRANTNALKKRVNIVALCDVNEAELETAAKEFPTAKKYVDFRECVEQKDLDAVVCSTIDHSHAIVNVWAMNRDLHVYSEKPLANSVYEARVVRQKYLEKADKIATQMGTQRHAIPNMERVAELIHDGIIGNPTEVRLWCGRTPTQMAYLPGQEKIPSGIHWDLWLGPSPYHPYNKTYTDKRQRGSRCLTWNIYKDFGSGQLGDMGSHIMDIAWNALDLGSPISVAAKGPEVNHPDSCPNWLTVKWEHPKNDWHGPMKVYWYDGGKMPGSPAGFFNLDKMKGQGAIFKGDQGTLVADFGNRYLQIKGDMTHYKCRLPEDVCPKFDFYQDWIDGCVNGTPTHVNFDYGGTLVENMMLALVAYNVGGEDRVLKYDPKTGSCPNAPEAMQYINRPYREGWTLDG